MNNWEALLAAAGIGGGGGLIGKKFTDRYQDKKIEANKKQIELAHQKIEGLQQGFMNIQSKVDLNTALDKEFRSTFAEHRSQMQRDVEDIKKSLNMLTSHLLR